MSSSSRYKQEVFRKRVICNEFKQTKYCVELMLRMMQGVGTGLEIYPGAIFEAFDSEGRKICLTECANTTGVNSGNSVGNNGREAMLQTVAVIIGILLPFSISIICLRILAAKNQAANTALAKCLPKSCLPKVDSEIVDAASVEFSTTDSNGGEYNGAARIRGAEGTSSKISIRFYQGHGSSKGQGKRPATKQKPIVFTDHRQARVAPVAGTHSLCYDPEPEIRFVQDAISTQQQVPALTGTALSSVRSHGQASSTLPAPAPFWTAAAQLDTTSLPDSSMWFSSELELCTGPSRSGMGLPLTVQASRAVGIVQMAESDKELNSKILKRREELFARARKCANSSFGSSSMMKMQGNSLLSLASKTASDKMLLSSTAQEEVTEEILGDPKFQSKVSGATDAQLLHTGLMDSSKAGHISARHPVSTAMASRSTFHAPEGQGMLTNSLRMRSLSPELQTPLESLVDSYSGSKARLRYKRAMSSPLSTNPILKINSNTQRRNGTTQIFKDFV